MSMRLRFRWFSVLLLLLHQPRSEARAPYSLALSEYLTAALRYPRAATDTRLQRRVYVSFQIGPDGKFNLLEVLDGPAALSAEVRRVWKNLPPKSWNLDAARYVLPVLFILEDVTDPTGLRGLPSVRFPGRVLLPEVVVSAAHRFRYRPAQVEQDATFPGGISALARYLQEQFGSGEPLKAGESVGGTVRFMVLPEGRVRTTYVDPALYGRFGTEVRRVLDAMPAWLPALRNGRRQGEEFVFQLSYQGPGTRYPGTNISTNHQRPEQILIRY